MFPNSYTDLFVVGTAAAVAAKAATAANVAFIASDYETIKLLLILEQ